MGVTAFYPPDNYPPDTIFVRPINDVGFRDAQNHDYALALTSPFKGAATDGADIGVDCGPRGWTSAAEEPYGTVTWSGPGYSFGV